MEVKGAVKNAPFLDLSLEPSTGTSGTEMFALEKCCIECVKSEEKCCKKLKKNWNNVTLKA